MKHLENLPEKLKGTSPAIEEIEAELATPDERTPWDLHQSLDVRRLRWLLFPAPIVLLLSLLALLPDAAAQDQARRSSLNKAIAILAAPHSY